jgi:hypothetical protein
MPEHVRQNGERHENRFRSTGSLLLRPIGGALAHDATFEPRLLCVPPVVPLDPILEPIDVDVDAATDTYDGIRGIETVPRRREDPRSQLALGKRTFGHESRYRL